VTEYLTRWCAAEALPDAAASTVEDALLRHVIFLHGCPVQLLSDQGPQFKGEVMQLISKALGIEQIFATPYHPQTNGLTERMNRTVKQILASFFDPLHQDWDTILPFAIHAYNTSVQTSTRISPFGALYGRDPRFPQNIHMVSVTPKSTDAVDWWLRLQQYQPLLRRALQHNLEIAQQR
jgi:hypothetical protein